MSLTNVTVDRIFEGSRATFLSRIVAPDGSYLTQADIDAITYYVYDSDDLTNHLYTGPIDKTTAVFDTLQTGNLWTIDDTGYNFIYTAQETENLEARHRYTIQFIFTLSTAETFPVVFGLTIRPIAPE